MKDTARVVIIGGGIAGCSLAYHLTQLGWTDIALVDKGQLTSGSTWHAAGIVTVFHTSPSLMRMRKYSMDLYKKLQADGGEQVGWRTTGSLRVASTPEHYQFLKRQVSQGRAIGLDLEIISPEEAKRLFPEMSIDGVFGAMYLPGDGYLDPSGVTYELARRAKERGAKMYTETLVTGIERGKRGEVTGVVTNQGTIKTEIVVNAAGMWAPRIGAMVGVNLPMTALTHQHLATMPIPGHELPKDTPVLRDPANLVYLREEQKGFLIGGFEVNPVPHFVDGAPWEFTQQLFPPDWELFDPILQGAIRRVPIIEKAEAKMLLNGPEAITPDSRPLLGPIPGVPGFYAAAGLSHTGFGGGGAIGQIVAEWIVDSEPSQDTSEYNVRRFGKIYQDPQFTSARSCESYRYYYFLRFPHDENESMRPLLPNPLDARLQALGAVFGEKNGWERVNYFDPGKPSRRAGADQRAWGWNRPSFFDLVCEEHQAVRERVGIFEMSSFGKVDVQGKGAFALLQKLTDSDLNKPGGSVAYTQMLNKRGGIESDLTITRLGDDHFRLVTGSAFISRDIGWLTMHLPDDDGVAINDVTSQFATIGIWGPNARNTLQPTTQDDVSNTAFPYMTAKNIHIAGVPVLAQRVTYVGELGWELYVPFDQATVVWDALMSAGKPFGIKPCGYKSLESLRLEKAYRYWTADITPADNPYEAGLGFCVNLAKGDFVGRDALRQAKADGIQRKLVTLTIDPNCVIYGGEAVMQNGKVVGRLRSGGYGYTVGKNIGLVYLPLELAKQGTEFQVDVFGDLVSAQVAPNVLYDPKGERL
ncbi:MAG: FAD-dependent oxidoreductase [Chloroflexi bacterium]|nr:FAD-dependent oxidoreductase [Chloroflexota bacterium]